MIIQIKLNGKLIWEDDVAPAVKLDIATVTKKEPDDKYSTVFDEVRKLYPGKKRGLDTEFKNFKNKERISWKGVLPFLYGSLLAQIEEKKIAKSKGEFVPEWPMFSVWINQRRWEIEPDFRPKPASLGREVNFKKL